jgi:hypothetical protein
MATDVSSIESKIKVEETGFDSSVSESLMQRIGGNINRLIDEKKRTIIHAMTTAGTRSWVCPQEVYEINVTCVGGGGGGPVNGASLISTGAGGGGMISGIAKVVPGTTYTFTTGAGGAPGSGSGEQPGSPGQSSTMAGFCSALGGAQGTNHNNDTGNRNGGLGGAATIISPTNFQVIQVARGGTGTPTVLYPNADWRRPSPFAVGSPGTATEKSGAGGGSYPGNGGSGASADPAGGGGGGYSNGGTGSGNTGGAGGTGAVIISYQLGKGITDNVPA